MNGVTARDGHTLDVLTNQSGTLRIEVSRLGAELVSLARKNAAGEWQGFLVRDGDVRKNPTGWNNHATVMGYYIHRIFEERADYHGNEIVGSTHSFLRHKTFAQPSRKENCLTYHFSAQDLRPGEYPFLVDFSISYLLTHSKLEVTFRFLNHETFPTHVSFGLHPGFGVTDLTIAEVYLPPGRYRRHLAPGNFLSGEIETIDFAGGLMPFKTSELPGSFLLDLAEVPDKTFLVFDFATNRKTTLDFSDVPYLTLWSDGGPFICVEPCWGLPDHHVQRPFAEKLGIQTIAAQGGLERSFSIEPEILD